MSDDAPRKRSWFQIHLSTAVVLMVVSGLLMWVNVQTRVTRTQEILFEEEADGGFSSTTFRSWDHDIGDQEAQPDKQYEYWSEMGWPVACAEDHGIWIMSGQGKRKFKHFYFGLDRWVALNLGVALAILTAVAVGCELGVRRKSACRDKPV